MTSPENPSPPADPANRSRRFWTLIAIGVSLFLLVQVALIFWWFGSNPSSTPSTLPDSGGPGLPVSLTEFADPETLRWRTAPHGTQVCEGVTFICEGAIRTAGLRAVRDGKSYPGAVLNVPVHGRGNRIHLLQASENSGGAILGSPYGRVLLHYTNGETRHLDLLFGAHGRDWMHNSRNPDPPILDATTGAGWCETNSRNGFLIRFRHAIFTNPLPAIELTSADFISPLHSANLLLFGFTVDNDPTPLPAPWQPSENADAIPPTDTVTVTLQDAAGRAPLSLSKGPGRGYTLAWLAVAPRGGVEFPAMPVDAQGRGSLDFQRDALREIRYTVTRADGKSLSSALQLDATGAFPSNTITVVSPWPGE